MKKLTALTVALMMSAGVAMAASHVEQPKNGERNGKTHGKIHQKKGDLPFGFEELNLSDAQKTKIKTIMEADKQNRPEPRNQAQNDDFRKNMETRRAQEQKLMASKNFDENAARKMIAERQAQREQQHTQQQRENGDRELQMLKKRHAVFQVLTPAQQKKYQENQQKRMAEMEKRRAERPQAPKGENK